MKGKSENQMTPYELENVRNEISKTQNWSHHKKAMYGIALLSMLKIPSPFQPNSSNTQKFVALRTSHGSPAEMVADIIEQLLTFEQVRLSNPLLLTNTTSSDTNFDHEFSANNASGILHIFHENAWLEVLNNSKQSLVLVVTGGLEGELTFYSNMCHHLVHLRKNGIFHLGNLAEHSFGLTTDALKIRNRI